MVTKTAPDRGGPVVRAAATWLDAHAAEPVLVHGSLPDRARDLDVLVRARAFDALSAALLRSDFEQLGPAWIRFDGCQPVLLDLEQATSWSLPDDEVEELFAAARPIDGYQLLFRPAPHHEILVLARRLTQHAGVLGARHRERLTAAADEDPAAWERARILAGAWGCRRSVEVLARAAVPDGRIRRAGALVSRIEERRRHGASPLGATVRAAGSFLARSPRGAVVALSGIDGAGKSTQAERLAAGLEQVGYQTVIEWARITTEPSLKAIALPIKLLLSLRARLSRRSGDTGARVETQKSDPRSRELRERSRLVGSVWAGIVAVVNARTLRRSTRKHVRAGLIVVRDRYVLDSLVQLEWNYAHGRDLGWQARLLQMIVPPPLASFLLDVPPERALARKPDDYDLDELRLHRETYLRHAKPHGAVVLDGARPTEEICGDVLRTTVRRLADRGH